MGSKKFILIIFIMTILVLPSCRNKHDRHDSRISKVYTCSMHPQILRSEPGNCPICGMTLVEKMGSAAADTLSGMQSIVNPVYQKFLFTQKTIKPEEKSFPLEIITNGIITYDTRYINNVSARVSGRIDKLFVRYPFQQLTKGQKLFEIYSPDLLTAQQNLLFLIKNDNTQNELIEASKEKLLLLGMKEIEIAEVIKSGKAKYLIAFYSDYTGYVVSRNYNNELNDVGKKSSGMSSGSDNNSKDNSVNVREGSYVSMGETMFKIIDNSFVWAVLKINLSDYPNVKINQKAEIFTGNKPEPVFKGRINFIETLNPDNQKTINVRVFINNDDKKLKIGQLVSAKIYTGNYSGIWIPSESILDLGKRKIVFIKKDKLFIAKVIAAGINYKSWTEVVSGIDVNDEIASNAQFFSDSESFINAPGDEK